jgi:hypothetical protein
MIVAGTKSQIRSKSGTWIYLDIGFVSFKDGSKQSNHKSDVTLLRDVVREPTKFSRCIISKRHLRQHKKDRLVSAFRVAGLDCGIPVVIKRDV